MNLKVIKLNDEKKYIIANEITSNNRIFYQLISIDDDESDFIFVEKCGDQLILIEDQILIMKLLESMCNNIITNKS